MDEYSKRHRDRLNLVIHVAMASAFVVGALSLVYGVLVLEIAHGVLGVVMLGAALGVQGLGHKREKVPPEPFNGPGDFVRRIFVEQFVTFPRFVFSGRWTRSWSAAENGAPPELK